MRSHTDCLYRQAKNHNKPNSEVFNSLDYLLHLLYLFCLQSEELYERMNSTNEVLTLWNITEYFQNLDTLLSPNQSLRLHSFLYLKKGSKKKKKKRDRETFLKITSLSVFATNSSFNCFNTLCYRLILKRRVHSTWKERYFSNQNKTVLADFVLSS